MSEYITKDAVFDLLHGDDELILFARKHGESESIGERLCNAITRIPAADVVSVEAYKQVMWERDTAIEQLAEYGVGLGEKKRDVEPVVLSHWELHGNDDDLGSSWFCRKCGWNIDEESDANKWNRCPRCGAHMSGAK